MIKNLLDDIWGIVRTRTFILTMMFLVMIGILVHRLYVLQIINGEDYLNTFTYRIQKDTEIESARGTIYDSNGVALAYNELSYSVVIEDSTVLTTNATKNTMIATLIEYIEKTGNEVIYDIPIELDSDGNLVFNAGTSKVLRFKKDIYSTETLSDEQIEATATEVYEYMRSKSLFNLDDSYDDIETALKILSVRYDLWMKRYEKYLSVTVATDVNDELVAAIKENTDVFPGVTIEQEYSRVYAYSKYFSNIVGYIGAISEDELTAYQESGDDSYSSSDLVGKTGIEAEYESVLKGTKGSQTLYVNSLGSVLEVAETVESVAGQDVYLTIDADLQIAAYDMLEERIAGILLSYMVDTAASDDSESIPIKDFYYALIDNNVISLSHISAETATSDEQSFYKKYQSYQNSVFNVLESRMETTMKELSSEYRSYINMAYSMLKANGIIDVSSLNSDDEMLTKWNNNKTSFSEFIQYAIANGLIDFTSLNLSEEYLDTDDIYAAIINYVVNNLPDYDDFDKTLCYYMLQNDYISGKDICLLLYAQDILDLDDDYYDLKSGDLSAYSFMYRKIYNLEITPDMLALKPCSGTYVMVDVNSGEVKALVSYPGYDANRINEVSYFSSLVNNNSSPFYNRATQQTIAPGSTYKPLVAIAALEEGIITAETTIKDSVTYTKVEPNANCWSSYSHGTINVADALKYSCNYFFYEVGYRMGSNNNTTALSDADGLAILSKYASMFGLDSKTGIELTEATSKVSDESVVRSAIGQGTNNFTAAQLARYIMAVANCGSLYELTIIDKIAEADGTVVDDNEPVLTSQLDISDSTWETVHLGLYKVCNESTYKKYMAGLGITLAGKSGTAQESTSAPNHGLFVGYAPYEEPEVAAAIIIPNGYGSSKVLDLYADIMCYYYGLLDRSDTRTANIPASSIQSD